MNISINGQVLNQTSIQNYNGTNYYHFNQTLPDSVKHQCSSFSITASSFSAAYGDSIPSIVEEKILIGILNFFLKKNTKLIHLYMMQL